MHTMKWQTMHGKVIIMGKKGIVPAEFKFCRNLKNVCRNEFLRLFGIQASTKSNKTRHSLPYLPEGLTSTN